MFTDEAEAHATFVALGFFVAHLYHLIVTEQHLTWLSMTILLLLGGTVGYVVCHKVREHFSTQHPLLRAVAPLPQVKFYEPRLRCYRYTCVQEDKDKDCLSHQDCLQCQCEICCQPYHQQFVVRSGKCGHVFHKRCMLGHVEYLLQHKHLTASIIFLRCMLCRQRLTTLPNDHYLCLKFVEGVFEICEHPIDLVHSLQPIESVIIEPVAVGHSQQSQQDFEQVSDRRAVGERSVDVGERSVDVGERSVDVGERSVDVGERSVDVAERSIDVAERSIDVAERSIDVAERSIDVAD